MDIMEADHSYYSEQNCCRTGLVARVSFSDLGSVDDSCLATFDCCSSPQDYFVLKIDSLAMY